MLAAVFVAKQGKRVTVPLRRRWTVGSDHIWRSQGAGFWGTRGPVSREPDARNSCEHSKSNADAVRP
jgi:hypothetical protein